MNTRVEREVLRIIARECDLEETLALSTSLASLDADSIDLISTIGALEERFGIEFPLEPGVIALETVGDIVTTVERQVVRRAAPPAPEHATPR